MQKQSSRDRTAASAVRPSAGFEIERASPRRRWARAGAINLYEKEREEHPKVRRWQRERGDAEDQSPVDGTGLFSDS